MNFSGISMNFLSLLPFFILDGFYCEITGRKTLLCYYPSWAAYRKAEVQLLPEQVDPFLCTHIVYVYAKLDEDNLILASRNPYFDLEANNGLDLYRRITSLKRMNPSLRVILGMGGFFDSNGFSLKNSPQKYSLMVSRREYRMKFITHAIYFLKRFNFDGLEVHWEFPNKEDKYNLAAYVQECKQAFRPRRLSLSLTLSTLSSIMDESYDIPTISRFLNYAVLMTYDFHGFYEGNVNLLSPLFLPSSSPLSVNHSVNVYKKKGLSPNKMVLGVATFGKSYSLLDRIKTLPGSASNGPGEEGPYTQTEGYLAYYEICEDDWVKMDDSSGYSGSYAFRDDQWVSFNDIDSVRAKSEFIIKEGLRGLAFWSMEQDDFNGNFCSQDPFPLISTAKRVFAHRNTTSLSAARKRFRQSSMITDRCTLPGLYEDPLDCRRYFVCSNGILSSRSCGEFLYWNQSCFCCIFSNLHCGKKNS